MEIDETIKEIKKALEWWESGLINKMEFYSMIWRASGALEKVEAVVVDDLNSTSPQARMPTSEEWERAIRKF